MKKHRLWFPLVVVAAAGASFAVATRRADEDLNIATMQALATGALALLLLGVWWLFLSRFPLRLRVGVFLGLALVGAVMGALVETDGTSGSVMPIVKWRFADDAGELASVPTTTDLSVAVDDVDELFVGPSDWPEFRGPFRDGIARGQTVGDGEPALVWRRSVGPGWSSFCALGDWLFTQEQRGEYECVVAYDASNGEERWVVSDEDRYDTYLGGIGPRATPTFSGGRLYTVGANGRVNALVAHSGERIWQRNMREDAKTKLIEWGYACSPLVVDDLVIVVPGANGGSDGGSSVIAYDRETGDVRWRCGDRAAGYAAARRETIAGEDLVLAFGIEGLAAHALDGGAELWFAPWSNTARNGSAQPLVVGERILLSVFSGGATLLEPKRSEAGAWSVDTVWAQRRFQLKFNGMVERDGVVYGLDGGILAAIDLETGDRLWKDGRYGFGQLLLADDALVVLTEFGDVVIAHVDREGIDVRAEFEAIDGKCWNHPVLRDGRLYVRSDVEMACYAF
ncbi:MAG: PQQ-binding-like beta-propeller repeat protein [Planctomycetota bacterium]